MISRLFFSFLLCLIAWLAGLVWFVQQIPASPTADGQADAIVVLTGGPARLEYGFQLFAQGRGKKLFISGVSAGVTTGQLLQGSRISLTTEMEKNIVLGYKATNTIGNAEETARWLKKQGYHSILLVTANYHMPRSIEEFEETAPDVTIIPAPVFPDNFTLSEWWNDDDSRTFMLSEYHKFIASQLRHLVVSLLYRRA